MTKSTKEIAKQIRQDLKVMKGYKFSVTMESFSGGSAINVNVMKSSVRMIRNMAEIPEDINPEINYTRSQIENMQGKKYQQLNTYQLRDEYNPESWCNGVFLTEAGHNDLMKIVEIAKKEHWDESDISVDYFHTNFYFHISLGKWDKDLIDGE